MVPFVKQNSIVRKIWGSGDIILFIFAGAAAEFALNKAVDWLYFTGKLPADPIGRLFSTVRYAGQIVFAPMEEANTTIDTIRHIHHAVESRRGDVIPDWAYRDVLYMLIDYSIRSFELLERKMNDAEKEEVFDVFYRVGTRMGLTALPISYAAWIPDRERHLSHDLEKSPYTTDLLAQYLKHLGPVRYRILVESQKLVIPERVRQLLGFGIINVMRPVLPLYKLSKWCRIDNLIKGILLPAAYIDRIRALDMDDKK